MFQSIQLLYPYRTVKLTKTLCFNLMTWTPSWNSRLLPKNPDKRMGLIQKRYISSLIPFTLSSVLSVSYKMRH